MSEGRDVKPPRVGPGFRDVPGNWLRSTVEPISAVPSAPKKAKKGGWYGHGPDTAAYDNLGHDLYGKPCPFVVCLCGWESSSANHDWQSVGQEFDAHLLEIT